jgi:hypothetical protein
MIAPPSLTRKLRRDDLLGVRSHQRKQRHFLRGVRQGAREANAGPAATDDDYREPSSSSPNFLIVGVVVAVVAVITVAVVAGKSRSHRSDSRAEKKTGSVTTPTTAKAMASGKRATLSVQDGKLR